MTAVLRERESVTPLELFFDLVFVLAITQCTALMAETPTWEGLAKGMLVLGVLWWCWVGYAWLTSVVDPEEGVVRLVIFAAMAGLLVAALCVPDVFDDTGLLFACAYAVVRTAQLALFFVASRDDPGLRRSITGLAAARRWAPGCSSSPRSPTGRRRARCGRSRWRSTWAARCSSAGGLEADARHFAERHGLIVIIALGESIVAIGVGAEQTVDAGIVAAAVLGTAVAATMWWLYFDVVALVAERRLTNAAPGREQNGIARDSYSFLHLPMVAGIVLVALGMKKTLAHVDDPLKLVPAVALFGGTAAYLLAHVAFRWRNIHTLNRQRLACSVLLVALMPLGVELPSLATLAMLAAILAGARRLRDAALRRGAQPAAPEARARALGRDPLPRAAQPEPACAVGLERERELAVELRVLHAEEVDQHALGVEREARLRRPAAEVVHGDERRVAPVGAVREDGRVVLRRAATSRPSRAPGTRGGGGSAAPSSSAASRARAAGAPR